MRKLFFALGIVLLSYTYSYSQQNFNNGNAPNVITTTEEEYNYITVGYPQAVAQGYDVKQGYSVKDLGQSFMNNYTITLKAFYRENVSNPIAILAICSNNVNPPEYFCIPTLNAYGLWSRVFKKISSEDLAGAKYEAITYALMRVLSENMLAK